MKVLDVILSIEVLLDEVARKALQEKRSG